MQIQQASCLHPSKVIAEIKQISREISEANAALANLANQYEEQRAAIQGRICGANQRLAVLGGVMGRIEK